LTNQNKCDIILTESEVDKMFVHEYDNSTEYETFEKCAEALDEWLQMDDIVPHLEFHMEDLLLRFCRRKSDEEFCNWLDEQIQEAIMYARDELITEHEDEDEEGDE
jgi:hypothetical protein